MMLCHAMTLCHAMPGRVAAENQTNRSEAALRQHYEERQRESEHVYELLENKIQLLQEVSSRPWWGQGEWGHMELSYVCCAGGQAGPQRGRAGHCAGQGRGTAVPGAGGQAERGDEDKGGQQEWRWL